MLHPENMHGDPDRLFTLLSTGGRKSDPRLCAQPPLPICGPMAPNGRRRRACARRLALGAAEATASRGGPTDEACGDKAARRLQHCGLCPLGISREDVCRLPVPSEKSGLPSMSPKLGTLCSSLEETSLSSLRVSGGTTLFEVRTEWQIGPRQRNTAPTNSSVPGQRTQVGRTSGRSRATLRFLRFAMTGEHAPGASEEVETSPTPSGSTEAPQSHGE